MTRTRIGEVQSRILEAVKAADPTITNRQLAEWMGCHPSDVSRFLSGERRMDVPELCHLLTARGVDAGVVLRVLAELPERRYRVEEETEEGGAAVNVGLLSVRVSAGAAGFAEEVYETLQDKRFTPEEVKSLSKRLARIISETMILQRALRPGRAS